MKVFEEIEMYFFNFELRPSLSCEVPVSFVFPWSSLDRGDLDSTVNPRIKVRFVLRFTTNARLCKDLSALFSSIFSSKCNPWKSFFISFISGNGFPCWLFCWSPTSRIICFTSFKSLDWSAKRVHFESSSYKVVPW